MCVPWAAPSRAQPTSSPQHQPGWTHLSTACLEQRAPATAPGKVVGDHPAYQAGNGNGVSQPSVLQESYLTLPSGGSPWLTRQLLTLMLVAHIHAHTWF